MSSKESKRADADLGLEEEKTQGATAAEFFARIGTILIIVSAIALIYVGFNFIPETSPSDQFNFAMLLIIGGAIMTMSMLVIFQNRISFHLNEVPYAIFTLVILTLAIFIAPGKQMSGIAASYTEFVQWLNSFGISGSIVVLIAKKPNFGPEANRRIYQAVGGWIGTIMAVMIFILGIYITYGFNISQYAGNGRYPGGKTDFFDAFLRIGSAGKTAMVYWFNIYGLSQTPGQDQYIPGLADFIWPVGWTIMIGAGIIFLGSTLRNRINLKLASGVLIAGLVVALVGISQFNFNYVGLNSAMYAHYVTNLAWDDVYFSQLQLRDPGLFLFGVVMILIEFIALFFIIYASFSAKPLDKWMLRRDRYIAAAEVATKEGKLDSAMKYLELAAEWSSKVDEEDKAVELLTKVRQIEKKAIQMKKSKAAEEAKKKMKDEEDKTKKGKEKVKEVKVTETAGTKKGEHVVGDSGKKAPPKEEPEDFKEKKPEGAED